jgi:hypothetical protein
MRLGLFYPSFFYHNNVIGIGILILKYNLQ